MRYNLTVNGLQETVDVAESTPLIWVLRDHLGLTGTKYSCGTGMCGACVVHIDGETHRSCVTSVGDAVGRDVTTIEGLSGKRNDALKQALLDEHAPQCGYCYSGQVMEAAALLETTPNPSRDDLKEGMSGVLCRCGTYPRILRALERVAKEG